ncbi:hypothetical protein HPP92_007706 [Vanilla planifolia]|uniref:Uncharacterized protein n=1 Tax=Vanilla planifolia TaxID=51239 RepID=A0A835RI12_VANPL|nr:hypothetical protein HPP92_007706 [Vanilla planifolia]
MASSNRNPAPSPAAGVGEESTPPGKTETLPTKAIYASAKLVQPMKPISQIKQHACSFALYGHDLSRQLEIDIFLSRRNNDFLQCAVYDSDKPSARLIGVEYIISAPLLERLPTRGAETLAFARLRVEGRTMGPPARARADRNEGGGEPGPHVRQVLVHVAGRPRGPPADGRTGADDVATGGQRGEGEDGTREEAGREIGDLERGVEGIEGGDIGARVDSSQRGLLEAARKGIRRRCCGDGDEANRSLSFVKMERKFMYVRCLIVVLCGGCC